MNVLLTERWKEAGYQTRVNDSSPAMSPSKDFDQSSDKHPGKPDYDLIVIGTGGAGVAAAIKAAEAGHTCAIIEAGTIGGTCVNIGCVPSKALLRAAQAYYNAGHHAFAGVHTKAEGLDWETIIAEKDQLVETLRKQKYVNVLEAYPEINVIQGRAKLQGDGSVLIDAVRPPGDNVIRGRKIVVATGARPRILPLDGVDSVDVLTSTSVMELKQLPQSMIIIGGRFIALEQAQIFSRFGTKVTIIQRSERLIPDDEPEISAGIQKYFEEEGITIHTGSKPISIREENGEKVIVAEIQGQMRELRAEQVLMAVGRIGNTDDLGLESLGIKSNSNGAIEVNDQLQTSHPDVYAAGDVTTHPQLVYVAATAGGIAAVNALNLNNEQKHLDLMVLPEVIFTDPQIAKVGYTEAQAKAQGLEVETAQIPLEYVPRAIAARNTRGLIKLVSDKETNTLLGAHILASEGGEIIQTAAMAIHFGIEYGFTVEDMRKMLFPYLTQVEGLKLATLTFNKDVAKLSCCAG